MRVRVRVRAVAAVEGGQHRPSLCLCLCMCLCMCMCMCVCVCACVLPHGYVVALRIPYTTRRMPMRLHKSILFRSAILLPFISLYFPWFPSLSCFFLLQQVPKWSKPRSMVMSSGPLTWQQRGTMTKSTGTAPCYILWSILLSTYTAQILFLFCSTWQCLSILYLYIPPPPPPPLPCPLPQHLTLPFEHHCIYP